jgi:GNAT superfamily N-acetyltransferase
MVTITEVRSKADWKTFERVPEGIHAADRFYVPPLPGATIKLLSPRGAFARHGDAVGFLAWRAGQAVGRIAAIENRAHNAYYQDHTGFFGFFDFVDDPHVSTELFTAAAKELAGRGLTTARGPYSPTVNDECGLLVDGFDAPPMIAMTYNPPYYLDHYERLGLVGRRDLHAYYITHTQLTPPRMQKIVDRVQRSTGITIRALDQRRLDRDLHAIHALYNETLCCNWGFLPLSLEEFQQAASEFKAVVDPELILFAEKAGEIVGFSMVLPNINEFLSQLRRTPRWLRAIKLAWQIKTRRPKEVRLAALGIKPEFRHKGLGALFYAETLRKGARKFLGGELSWVDAQNAAIIQGITLMGAKRYKSYRIFERALT